MSLGNFLGKFITNLSDQLITIEDDEEDDVLNIDLDLDLEIDLDFSKLSGIKIMVYKVHKDECGEVEINEEFFKYAKKFGVEKGECDKTVFKISKGKKRIKIPILEEILIDLYEK